LESLGVSSDCTIRSPYTCARLRVASARLTFAGTHVRCFRERLRDRECSTLRGTVCVGRAWALKKSAGKTWGQTRIPQTASSRKPLDCFWVTKTNVSINDRFEERGWVAVACSTPEKNTFYSWQRSHNKRQTRAQTNGVAVIIVLAYCARSDLVGRVDGSGRKMKKRRSPHHCFRNDSNPNLGDFETFYPDYWRQQ